MARIATITNSNSLDWVQGKCVVCQPRSIGKIASTFLLGTLICAASVLYIFQVNKAATMGYEIKKQEKAIEQLKQENENLKIKAAELRSIYNIENDMEQMQMVRPDDVTYVEVEDSVAMK